MQSEMMVINEKCIQEYQIYLKSRNAAVPRYKNMSMICMRY